MRSEIQIVLLLQKSPNNIMQIPCGILPIIAYDKKQKYFYFFLGLWYILSWKV